MDETSEAPRPTPFGVGPRTWRRFTHGVYSLVPILAIEDGDLVRAGAGDERLVVARTFAHAQGQKSVNLHLVPADQAGAQPDIFNRPAAAYVQAMRPVSRRVFIAGRIQDVVEKFWPIKSQEAWR